MQKVNRLLNDKLIEIDEEKNKYYKIYNKQKALNNNLNKQINDIKGKFDEYKKESIIAKKEHIYIKKSRKIKNNKKKEIISNLQRKIQDFKEMISKNGTDNHSDKNI